ADRDSGAGLDLQVVDAQPLHPSSVGRLQIAKPIDAALIDLDLKMIAGDLAIAERQVVAAAPAHADGGAIEVARQAGIAAGDHFQAGVSNGKRTGSAGHSHPALSFRPSPHAHTVTIARDGARTTRTTGTPGAPW